MAWTVSSVRVRAPRIALFLILIAVSLACFPSLLSAQTVSPQIVEFDPSADHNASVDGVAVVERLRVALLRCRRHAALHVIELGKPTPEATARSRFNFAALLGAWPCRRRVRGARRGGRARRIDAERRLEPVVFRHDSPAAPPTPPPPTPPPPPSPSYYSLSTSARRVARPRRRVP